jgi:hypothetical protein
MRDLPHLPNPPAMPDPSEWLPRVLGGVMSHLPELLSVATEFPEALVAELGRIASAAERIASALESNDE